MMKNFCLISVLLIASHSSYAQTAETTEQRLTRVERELADLKAQKPASAPEAAVVVEPISNLSEGTSKSASKANLAIGGYAEFFYQWNFNQPSNGITNFRGFDNRHNSFTIANAVVDLQGSLGPFKGHSVFGHLALQIGHTPETYYLAEPVSPGSSGAGATSASVWKYLQQANVGYRAPLGRGLLLEGGIFLSPIGPEGMAIKDQWNWSRSNLFFGLPFYHTGVRLSYNLTDRIALTLAGYNGWNSVVDGNPEKSLSGQFTYNIPDKLTYQFLYFTGVERPNGAPEGRAWRHLFDTYAAYYPSKWLSLLAHANAGFEPNNFGTAWWAAGALYGRFQPLRWLYIAARVDFFYEGLANSGSNTSAPIFFPADWVTSATGTLDFRPIDNISLRIEYRHDQAERPIYFRNAVASDTAGLPLTNARAQNTLTFGATTWF